MKKIFAATAFLALAGTATAGGNIIDQARDGINGYASEENTTVSIARTADDFNSGAFTLLTAGTFSFLVDPNAPLQDWRIELYTDAGGAPTEGDPFYVATGGTANATGGTNFGFDIVDVSFDGLAGPLDASTNYWVSVQGLGNGQGRAFWETSGDGTNQNGAESHLKSEFFQIFEWTPWTDLVGNPSDNAMSLNGVPAPGALALLGIAGLAARRRRRA